MNLEFSLGKQLFHLKCKLARRRICLQEFSKISFEAWGGCSPGSIMVSFLSPAVELCLCVSVCLRDYHITFPSLCFPTWNEWQIEIGVFTQKENTK